ncbi:MAG: AAA family ATPase [Gemmataceae bacterium]
MTPAEMEERAQQFRQAFARLQDEVGKVIVGHAEIVEGVLTCIFAGGHALLEGVPGLGKTLLVRTLGQALDLKFSRIQFTPDLMPADIIGTNVVMETPEGKKVFHFQPGPLFAQIVLADEINRATPKTQSALLEAMQEHSVTVGGVVHRLQEPFFVLATQNPIEQEGTYPLPEAQLDRFFYKLIVPYSRREEIAVILERTTRAQSPRAQKVMDGTEIVQWQQFVREVLIAQPVQDYLIRLVLATHPQGEFAVEETNRYLRYGASPRGAQALALAGKVRALLHGRYHVSMDDIRHVYVPAMRHRVLLNFEAQAEGVSSDTVLKRIVEQVPETERQPAFA